MLTKDLTRQLDLPHEPGAWITVRGLGYVALERARQRKLVDQIGLLRQLGDVQSVANKAEASTDEPDPLAAYDLTALLEEAIVAWSYEEPVSPEAIHSLDEVTAKFVGHAVLPGGTEEARKNGIGAYTATLTE